MSYDYAAEKAKIFTETGQVTFLKIRDWLTKHLAITGCARVDEIIRHSGATDDSFTMLACIDRLIELQEFRWGCGCDHTGPHTYCIVQLYDHSFGCELHPNE